MTDAPAIGQQLTENGERRNTVPHCPFSVPRRPFFSFLPNMCGFSLTAYCYCLLLLLTCHAATAQNLLSGKYTTGELQQLLAVHADSPPFPRCSDRNRWTAIDTALQHAYIREAEQYLNYNWPVVPATAALAFYRTGDRSAYQDVSYRKRAVLGTMMIAEAIAHKGRFVDPIVNGIWSICEESWWGTAAHLSPDGRGLPDVTQPRVELYVAVTGAVLAWCDYLLGEQLDAVSPRIRPRIRHEINRRILQPLMAHHHGWMGQPGGGAPNNWNPWICSNWLVCTLLLDDNAETRAATVAKILQTLDHFVNAYPADGGCNEGPHYWNAAAGTLYDNLALLNAATGGAFNYAYADEKIRNMARFIPQVQIGGDWFLNFADSPPRPTIDAGLVYRMGRAIADTALMQFGAYYYHAHGATQFPLVANFFSRHIAHLFIDEELRRTPPRLPLPQEVWLPQLQVAAARDREGDTAGFFMAVKGGHNNESHNHNDVGNYVVYYNGRPLLIDVGTGRYTAETFSDRRYEIWNHRSDYHNTPTINGVTQSAGSDYGASGMQVHTSDTATTVSLNIAGAYPVQAGVRAWVRTVTLHRSKKVVVRDEARLAKARPVTLHLMTCYPAAVTARGELSIYYRDAQGNICPFKIHYDDSRLYAEVEKINLTTGADQGVLVNWGDTLHRINLHTRTPNKNHLLQLTINNAF
jgi:hypothetical protein